MSFVHLQGSLEQLLSAVTPAVGGIIDRALSDRIAAANATTAKALRNAGILRADLSLASRRISPRSRSGSRRAPRDDARRGAMDKERAGEQPGSIDLSPTKL